MGFPILFSKHFEYLDSILRSLDITLIPGPFRRVCGSEANFRLKLVHTLWRCIGPQAVRLEIDFSNTIYNETSEPTLEFSL